MCPENDSHLSHIQRTCTVMTVLLAQGSGTCSGDVTKGNKDILPPGEAFFIAFKTKDPGAWLI